TSDNPALQPLRHDLGGVLHLFTSDALAHVRPDGPDAPDIAGQALFRPLTLALWALVLRASDAPAPARPFHLLPLLARAAVVVLLWSFLRRACGRRVAALAALLFALHPLPVAAVAHAAALGTLLSAAAVLAGLLCWRAATADPEHLRGPA